MPDNRLVARNVTDEGLRLFDAIKAAGDDGLTRRQLEDAIGKKLNRWSWAQLDLLASLGRITIEGRPLEGRLVYEYLYRVVEE